MNYFKSFLSLFLGILLVGSSCLASSSTESQQDKLIVAIDVIRHGDRNPILEIPKAPHTWPEGLEQLTPLGMRQEYELGKKLRRRYVDHDKLLPKSYQPGTLYVRSTEVDRTLMSAECFLMGLYPPGTGPLLALPFQPALPHRAQPIPIHTVPTKQDFLVFPSNFKKLVKENVCSGVEWKRKNQEVQPRLAAWSKATGLPLHSLNDLILLSDTLFIDELKHVPLPKGLSKEDAATIIKASNWEFVAIFKNPIIGKATGGALLRDIAQHLQEAAQQKIPLKYFLYSAHDGTILALMSALRVPLNVPPRYTSDVNISLFSRGKNDTQEYYVQVTMNGEVVQLPCHAGSSCSLKQFLAFAEESQ